tara:strand:+ start:1112 stop:1837 length:726 start_codon:yes stop_codon:yes gene_type:complete
MSTLEPNPLHRLPVFSLSSSTSTVGFTEVFRDFTGAGETSGGDDFLPDDDANAKIVIANSAGDPITGLKRRSPEMNLSAKFNKQYLTQEILGSSGKINNADWGMFSKSTLLITNLSANQSSALVDSVLIDYWEVSVTCAYRRDTWHTNAPDVGLFYLEVTDADAEPPTTVKKRFMYTDEDGFSQKNPERQPLNADGTARGANEFPKILNVTERIYEYVDFSTLIGLPPETDPEEDTGEEES